MATISELPGLLISARIARGISQRGLPDRLGLREHQIQRYEASDYASASFAGIKRVVSALGMELDGALPNGEEYRERGIESPPPGEQEEPVIRKD
ncbi:MAG: hypothetical protein OXC27_15610 [Caldilineaceae bacterium]|nr:hypothetical protein [Caldilineaceae bacterium]